MDRIDALRLLLDVAEMGSFSSVARQREIATSTVALAVSQLEQELDARRVIRSTRKLTFTHEGISFLGDARRIVADWDGALSSLKDDGPLAGPLRVTATNDFGRYHLRRILDDFQLRHPGIHITLVLNDAAVDLIDERFDLAIRSGPLADSGLRARRLLSGARLVCAAPVYWERHGKPEHPNDLENHNCLILARPEAPISVWSFLDGGKTFSIRASGDRQCNEGDVLRQWAIQGFGIIFKNEWDIWEDVAAGRLETALDGFVAGPTDLYAVYPESRPSRRLAALIEHVAGALRTEAASLRPNGGHLTLA